MIQITTEISIPEDEILLSFIRASGPGGQNVNKVASAVQLRFDIRNTSSLEPEVKERLYRIAGKRVTEDGVLIIEAHRYRSQEQNRQDALRRLVRLIQAATTPPKKRIPTRSSPAGRARRLKAKRRRSEIKLLRLKDREDWD